MRVQARKKKSCTLGGGMRKFSRIAFFAAFAGLLSILLGAARAEDVPYHWQNVPFGGGGYVPGYVYHPKQKGLLYARTDVGGLYRFDYATQKWVQLLDNFGHDDGELMGVLSIAIDPNDPSKLYTANGFYLGNWARKGAIMRSSDQGDNLAEDRSSDPRRRQCRRPRIRRALGGRSQERQGPILRLQSGWTVDQHRRRRRHSTK